MGRESVERYDTPERKPSKIWNLTRRIFSLFKKKTDWSKENETIVDHEHIPETYSLLDDDMKKVAQAIKNIVAQELQYDADDIYPEQDMRKALYANEENMMNILTGIQDTLNIPEADRKQTPNIRTIKDLIQYVEKYK